MNATTTSSEKAAAKLEDVKGLIYIDNFITEEQTQEILKFLKEQKWGEENSYRRTVQFGYRYDFLGRQLTHESAEVGKIPEIFSPIIKILEAKYFEGTTIEQMIVNEYKGCQGIGKHFDRSSDFGEVVGIISLLNPTVMRFHEMLPVPVSELKQGIRSRAYTNRYYDLVLKPNSLAILSGDARYQWAHEIDSKQQILEAHGTKIVRDEKYQRISLTFRSVIHKGV